MTPWLLVLSCTGSEPEGFRAVSSASGQPGELALVGRTSEPADGVAVFEFPQPGEPRWASQDLVVQGDEVFVVVPFLPESGGGHHTGALELEIYVGNTKSAVTLNIDTVAPGNGDSVLAFAGRVVDPRYLAFVQAGLEQELRVVQRGGLEFGTNPESFLLVDGYLDNLESWNGAAHCDQRDAACNSLVVADWGLTVQLLEEDGSPVEVP